MAQVRILLISDDDVMARYLMEKLIISGGYFVSLGSDIRMAMGNFTPKNFDTVILKFDMPGINRAELVKELKRIDPDCVIIAFTGGDPSQFQADAARLGAYDFIAKPINLEKLIFTVRKGAEFHSVMLTQRRLIQSIQEQNTSLQKQNTLLAKRIEESTKNLTRLYEDLRSTYMRTIKVLAQAIDARDHYTHSHSQSVARYAVAIAQEMKFSPSEIEIIRDACELHDLGKIGIDDSILSKPTELTEQERELIKKHPITAANILEPLTFLSNVVELVKQHHEHYDGTGYPEGLVGEAILPGARIIHLADAYDAMCSARSYRKEPLSKEEAIFEIKKNSGTQFDPKVVEAFLRIADKL